MNIVLFHNLPSGGALKMLGHTTRLLSDRGHSVQVYFFSTAEKEFSVLSPAISTVMPLRFSVTNRVEEYEQASRNLADEINRSDADFVWVDKCRFVGVPSIVSFLTKPHLMYLHEPLRNFQNEYRAENKFSIENIFNSVKQLRFSAGAGSFQEHLWVKNKGQQNFLAARSVLTNSEYSGEWIQRVYGIRPNVLHPCVDTDFFIPRADVLKKNQVLSVGRMDVMKGYDFLLEVLALVPSGERPMWNIVCDAMDEKFYQRFQRRAEKLKVAYKIHQRISEEKLRELYRESSWTLCASIHEPFGLVPLESMACGTPVFAVKEGGFKETVMDGTTGYLLPRDVSIWAERIQACVMDSDLVLRFGQAAVACVRKKWSSKDWCDRLAAATGISF